MGFKDLENFNLALLGKQVWRILEKPECLMARVLKQRYFKNTNILHAPSQRKASFVFRSILQGRDLVKKGLRFMVGDGTMISAWNDPWLPLHPPRPPQAKQNIVEHHQVANWIHESGIGWNETRIRELVVEEDANIIMAIKLCRTAATDILGWHYSKDGIYSVKSAYWLAN